MRTMLLYGLAILLVILTFLALALEKTYFYLPYKELKRRAASGDEVASELFRAGTYGADLRLLLITVAVLGAAGTFVILAAVLQPALSFILVAVLLLLAYGWMPRGRLSSVHVRLAIWATPVLAWLLRTLHPATRRLVSIARRTQEPKHTGLFEREDVYDLLDRQVLQPDNRIGDQELELMRQALQFGDYKVRDIVVPAAKVKAVNADLGITPVFLAELHETGHPRFPVYDGKPDNIIGTLAIDAVADVRQHGKVRDSFDPHPAFIHEEDSLRRALRAFYETHQHMFVVVNRQREYVGIVTLSDILHLLFGAIEHEKFGHHDDAEAVSRRHDKEPKKEVAETPTEVVE